MNKNQEEIKEEKWPETDLALYNGKGRAKAILTVYVDVGSLPPIKAEAYISRIIDKWKPVLSRLPEDYGAIFIPIRADSGTRIEIIPLEFE